MIFGLIYTVCYLGTSINRLITKMILDVSHYLALNGFTEQSEMLTLKVLMQYDFGIWIGDIIVVDLQLFVQVKQIKALPVIDQALLVVSALSLTFRVLFENIGKL